MNDAAVVLKIACERAGLDGSGACLIRAGENTLYRLPGAIVARVTRTGQWETACKEVRVSRWLRTAGVAVVEAISDLPQPIDVGGRAVTFWRELPQHQEGTVEQFADVLRQIHSLQPPPDLGLPPLDPFTRLDQRIDEATVFTNHEQAWLRDHLAELRQRYRELPPGSPHGAVHGDAWGGNIVATAAGPVLLDLERFAFGPPEWDLISIAADRFLFGALPGQQWPIFCHRYGYDVTEWAGYPVLRDARELRKVTFAAQMAAQDPRLAPQARHRLACIQGRCGPRPWQWRGVP